MSRKARVTEEHSGEALRLRKIWDATPDKPSQVVFGEKYGIGNQSAVGQFLNGRVPLSMKAAMGFARGLGCNIADFSPRLALEILEGSRLTTGEPLKHDLDFGGRGGNVQAVRVTGEIWIADELEIHPLQDAGYVVGSGVIDGYAIRARGDGGSPAIRDGHFLVVEQYGRPGFSDYCIVETSRGQTYLVEFLAERENSFSFEAIGSRRRITLQKDDISRIDGVVAIVSPRRWRADPTADLFSESPPKPGL